MRARPLLVALSVAAACHGGPGAPTPPGPRGTGDGATSADVVSEARGPVDPPPLEGERSASAPDASASTTPIAAGSSAPPEAIESPSQGAGKRVWSVGQTSWIRARPEAKEGDFLGYVRTGSSIELASETRVPGKGCPGGFWRVVPRGYLCRDRTITESPREAFRFAAEATRGGAGPFPYGYAFSNGAPMYNRVPTPSEQARFERWLGAPGSHAPLPKTLRSHEELAVAEPIAPRDPVPAFLTGKGSAREAPFDLVEQTLPLGSMLSYTKVFEAEGRSWVLSTDHTLVPADRLRPFRPSAFRGVELGGEVQLPIAWMRERARPRWVRDGASVRVDGAFPVRTFVALTGNEVEVAGRRYLETRSASEAGPHLVLADDATVVAAEPKRATGVKPGQKWLLVRLTQGTLVAYDDLTPVFATLISPGAGGVPVKGRDPVKDSTTPLGAYSITFKDRAATMSPETGKNRSFWIQDVPHTQYFAPPFALHAAYWHERFGEYVSAGCINLSPLDAERLFAWTDPPVPDGWQGATGAGAPENGPTSVVVVRR